MHAAQTFAARSGFLGLSTADLLAVLVLLLVLFSGYAVVGVPRTVREDKKFIRQDLFFAVILAGIFVVAVGILIWRE